METGVSYLNGEEKKRSTKNATFKLIKYNCVLKFLYA